MPQEGQMREERPLLLREWHMERKYAYLLLAFSILSEQIGTACLEASKGYTILSFSVLAICLYFITYFIFCKILSEIDLAVAYAEKMSGGRTARYTHYIADDNGNWMYLYGNMYYVKLVEQYLP